MEKHGTVSFKGRVYQYEVDEHRFIWIIEEYGKTNIGQTRPLLPSDNVEQIVLEMLTAGGY